MKKKISIKTEQDIYEKFCIALGLNNETMETALENCIRMYIAKTFDKVSKSYTPSNAERKTMINDAKDFYGKAIGRIPVWAVKKEQYNHKIIRAYFAAVDVFGIATISAMEQLCSNDTYPELYVPTFKNNYSQMKLDGAKTHGKVFEDNGTEVWIWDEVKDVLMHYKQNFYEDGFYDKDKIRTEIILPISEKPPVKNENKESNPMKDTLLSMKNKDFIYKCINILAEQNRENDIKKLTDAEYCKNRFDMNFAVLQEVPMYGDIPENSFRDSCMNRRYYPQPVTLFGKRYILCNDWYYNGKSNARDTRTAFVDWIIG